MSNEKSMMCDDGGACGNGGFCLKCKPEAPRNYRAENAQAELDSLKTTGHISAGLHPLPVDELVRLNSSMDSLTMAASAPTLTRVVDAPGMIGDEL